MTSDEETRDSGLNPRRKKRRVPAPRKKGGGENPSGSRVPPRRVPAPRETEGEPAAAEATPASPDDQAAAQQAAAQQAAAKQAAAQQAAAKQAAAKQAAAQQAAAKQAAAKQAAAQAAAQASTPGTPGKPAAATPPTGRAPARGGKRKVPRRKTTRRGAPSPAQVAGRSAEENDFQPAAAEKSKLPLVLGIGIPVVIVIIGVAFWSGSDDTETIETPVVVETPKVDLKKQREDEAREMLARVEETNAKDPGDRLSAAYRLEAMSVDFRGTEAGQEAGTLRATLIETWRSEVDQAWNSLKGDVRGSFQSGDFAGAVQLLAQLPRVFEGAEEILESSFETELSNLRHDAKEQLHYKQRLDELSLKAGKYAKKGYDDIAIAIINALDDRVEDEAPDVWKLKEDLVKQVQRDGLAMLIEQEGVAEAELAEARRLEAEQKKAERAERWLELRDSVPWSKKLAASNLYNWIVSSDRQLLGSGQQGNWRVLEREGQAHLIGDNRSGGDMFLGLFSNHWEDYVCHFEVNIREGALRISPRTNSRGGAVGDQTSPMLELGDDFPSNRWVSCILEVHEAEVVLRYGDSGTEIRLDPETTRLPAAGGFVFYIADGARLELRDIRVKLVSDRRGGGIWARRGS